MNESPWPPLEKGEWEQRPNKNMNKTLIIIDE